MLLAKFRQAKRLEDFFILGITERHFRLCKTSKCNPSWSRQEVGSFYFLAKQFHLELIPLINNDPPSISGAEIDCISDQYK